MGAYTNDAHNMSAMPDTTKRVPVRGEVHRNLTDFSPTSHGRSEEGQGDGRLGDKNGRYTLLGNKKSHQGWLHQEPVEGPLVHKLSSEAYRKRPTACATTRARPTPCKYSNPSELHRYEPENPAQAASQQVRNTYASNLAVPPSPHTLSNLGDALRSLSPLGTPTTLAWLRSGGRHNNCSSD